MHIFWLLLIEILALLSVRECVSAITKDEIDFYLGGHNRYRKMLLDGRVRGQPQAAEMPMMTWSPALSEKAKEWAEGCNYGHDSLDHRLISGYQWVGQNVAGASNWNTALDQWWTEHNNYNFWNNSCSGECGHYTQMAWSDSILLGCYNTSCSKRWEFPDGFFTVCNYAPGGNFDDQIPYQPVIPPKVTPSVTEPAKQTAEALETTPAVTEPAKEYDSTQIFLEGHNIRRQLLKDGKVQGQPRALEMPHMVWNDALTQKAKEWADNCTFGHDSLVHRLIPGYTWVGQNVAAGPDWHTSMEQWWAEHKYYNYSANTCSGECGHYTQMAWAKSVQLGCYKKDCSQRPGFPYGYFTVCNYAPGGNYAGQRPYIANKTEAALETTPAVTEPAKEYDSTKFFLEGHNIRRQLLKDGKVEGQPRALEMPHMMWNEALAVKAKEWADNCTFAHDTIAHRVIPGYDWVGQNVAAGTDWHSSIEQWWSERKNYIYSNNSCSGVCGHYIQMAWADSVYLGCHKTNCTQRWKFPPGYLTVCNYAPGGNIPGQKPYKAEEAPQTTPAVLEPPEEDKWPEFFLTEHNTKRQLLKDGKVQGQPQADEMPKMIWHPLLAAKAKNWSSQCKFSHDSPSQRKIPGYDVGQNIASVKEWRESTGVWWDEHKYYNYDTGNCTKQCDNYTQMAWANSIYVGCGVAKCPDPKNSEMVYFVVCDYAPGGNLPGEKPYLHFMSSEKIMRDYFLPRHNHFRRTIKAGKLFFQPGAKYMPELRWNSELFMQAKETSALCNVTITPGKYSLPGYSSVGQVIIATYDHPMVMFYVMIDGFVYYNYDKNECSRPDGYCDGYKQIAYAKTALLGCHFRTCRIDIRDRWIAACNYAVGADLSQRPYEKV